MKTAQEIIASLPAKCFGVLPIDQSIVIIKAGESGYYNTAQPPASWLKEDGVEAFVNECNAEDGVTIAQRKAMEHGSMFGWGCGAADPDNWTEDGKHKNEKGATA